MEVNSKLNSLSTIFKNCIISGTGDRVTEMIIAGGKLINTTFSLNNHLI